MADVVILTARFGHGHYSAADNVRAALEELYPTLQTRVLDPFEIANPRYYNFLRRLYRFTANRLPGVWHLFFRLTDRYAVGERRFRSHPVVSNFFRTLPETHDPRVVISTYPIFADAVEHLCPPGHRRTFQVLTMVTDSVTVNRAWVRGKSDLWMTADPLTARTLEKMGVPPDRIADTGFPTPPRFVRLLKEKGEKADGGRDRALTLLYLPNLGTQNLFRILDILGCNERLKVILALGQAPRLIRRARYRVERLRCDFEVLGWCPDIPDRMLESDMVITKAGGATVHEALAAGCPVVISRVTPGQEEGNARLIESLGMGIVVRDVKGLSRLLHFFQQVDYQVLDSLRRNVERFRRPDAAYRIAELARGRMG